MRVSGHCTESAPRVGSAIRRKEYGPSDSAVALLFEDNAGPDVYVSTDRDQANAPLLPMPTAVPPPPLGSCDRHCKFHVAEGVHDHFLSNRGLRQAAELVGTLEKFELQSPGSVAKEVSLDATMLDDQVCYVQLGDTAVLDRRPGDVRMAGGTSASRWRCVWRLTSATRASCACGLRWPTSARALPPLAHAMPGQKRRRRECRWGWVHPPTPPSPLTGSRARLPPLHLAPSCPGLVAPPAQLAHQP